MDMFLYLWMFLSSVGMGMMLMMILLARPKVFHYIFTIRYIKELMEIFGVREEKIVPYNEVKHTKIPKAKEQNDLLTLLIELSHEDTSVVVRLKPHLKEIVDSLATMSDVELSQTVNYIVREVRKEKRKKEK